MQKKCAGAWPTSWKLLGKREGNKTRLKKRKQREGKKESWRVGENGKEGNE